MTLILKVVFLSILESREVNIARCKWIFVEIEGLDSIHKVLSRQKTHVFSQWDKRNINSQIIKEVKVILHQIWVKKYFPWNFNLEYGGTFTKLFMHVSSRNMFPTIRNLQIRVHVYRPRHCCADWLTFGCFVPMIADHYLVTKR